MIREWFLRHPLTGYFALVFGISWGGIAVILAAHGFDLSPMQPVEGGLMFLMLLLGPSVSGFLCIAILDGRAGLNAPQRPSWRWQGCCHLSAAC